MNKKMAMKVRNLSCVLGFAITSSAQISLSKIDIPLSLEFVYHHLLGSRLIASTLSKPMQPPFPMQYNLDKRCEYHGAVLGHSVE
jgi:hypothetical protein